MKFREFWDQFEVSVQDVDVLSWVFYRCSVRCDIPGLLVANQGNALSRQRSRERFHRPQVALDRSTELSAICDECHRGVYYLSAQGKDSRNRVGGRDHDHSRPSHPVGQAGCGGWQPGSRSTSDVMRKLNDLRLEEKRSMRAVEKLRSPSQERETQKTVALFHSVVEVVCGFCQDHHTLSECMNLKQASRQKQREKATHYQLCSPASSRSVSPQLASVIDERIVYNIWTVI
ncbi:hypothetical protein T03_642 [Trichinella britovi]|uniref:Uncharacterized protein n=1 Tax=Trichinella britovi TaxID=45882 RepID=A0A0V1CSG1_TRIBR|nr:hypothetical protein T03_642 [Trichinella britovi]